MKKPLLCVIAVLVALTLIFAGCQRSAPPAPPETPPATPAPAVSAVATPEPSPAAEGAIKAGDQVAAPWGGGQYLGTVEEIKGESASVKYADDQIVREVKLSDLQAVVKKEWKVGDKVLAVWSAGRFYSGVVEADNGNGTYKVKWDDGSAPSDVEAMKIIEPSTPKKEEGSEKSPGPAGIKAGDTVVAPWGGDKYHGTVETVKGDVAGVKYTDDQVVREVRISELKVIANKEWKPGDKVLAVWSSGKFYCGVIEADNGNDTYKVKWDDGSAPSNVEAMKIVEP